MMLKASSILFTFGAWEGLHAEEKTSRGFFVSSLAFSPGNTPPWVTSGNYSPGLAPRIPGKGSPTLWDQKGAPRSDRATATSEDIGARSPGLRALPMRNSKRSSTSSGGSLRPVSQSMSFICRVGTRRMLHKATQPRKGQKRPQAAVILRCKQLGLDSRTLVLKEACGDFGLACSS